jgi:hypothetical protein
VFGIVKIKGSLQNKIEKLSFQSMEQIFSLLVNLTMEILLGISVMGIAVFGLAIGFIFNGRQLHGSCRGASDTCTTCNGQPEECTNTHLPS